MLLVLLGVNVQGYITTLISKCGFSSEKTHITMYRELNALEKLKMLCSKNGS